MTKQYKPVAEMTVEEVDEFLRDQGLYGPEPQEVGKDSTEEATM